MANDWAGRRANALKRNCDARAHLRAAATRRLRVETLETRRMLAAAPELLRDIGIGDPSNPTQMTQVGALTFFVANDGTHGSELWKTDGTAGGTSLVKDTNAGAGDGYFGDLTNVNGTLFFASGDLATGIELWKSDGTDAGTGMVKEITPGFSFPGPRNLTNVGGTLYFTLSPGAPDGVLWTRELWKSDGTAAGTTRLKVFQTDAVESDIRELTNVNGTLFFRANDGASGDELWRSVGTAASTTLVKDINPGPGSSKPGSMFYFAGALYFRANDGTNGDELWRSNGFAAGTTLVKDIWPGSSRGYPQFFTELGGKIYFRAYDGTSGGELWMSDGTTAGTTIVKDIRPGSASSVPMELTLVNGTLIFRANDGSHGYELWRSDGTAAGTTLVRDVQPDDPAATPGSTPKYLTKVNNTLFFRADDGSTGDELWKSDGTAAGTVLVKDIVAGQFSAYPTGLANANGKLFFAASDATHGTELWTSDGTPAGTNMVLDINPGTLRSSVDATSKQLFTQVGSVAYFVARGNSSLTQLWLTDGTTAGTVLVKDVQLPGGIGGYISRLTNVGGTLFFSANDGTHGFELWKSDGTVAGTGIVKQIGTGSTGAGAGNLTNVGGTLFFTATDGITGNEVWKSDGTEAGTVQVKDIRPGASGSGPRYLTNVNGTLYFRAYSDTAGYELWKSNGTADGTVMVRDILGGSGGGNPKLLTNVGGSLFFTANDGANGRELWHSDGSEAGTAMVKDIRAADLDSYPRYLTNVNGTLYFTVYRDPDVLTELWKSDGTAGGTALVKEFADGAHGLANVNGTLIFSGNDGVMGGELWKSDGTTAGTTLIRDINPGPARSNSGNFTNIGGTLYFTADDAVHGMELWQSDGTPLGTVLVMDILPGTGASKPGTLSNFNGTLIFAADDGVHGVEPWIIPPDVISLSPALVSKAEGNAGPTNFLFTVSLSTASDQAVTVGFATSDGSATLANNDYQATSGVLTFAPGETTRVVTVLVNGDAANEPDESFTLNLSDPVNAALGSATSIAMIENDDPVSAVIAGRYLFYNQSVYDGGSAAVNASDDGAIATDKTAYRPTGALATFASVSSYSRGINGIMIDLAGPGSHGSISANDFVFKVGNDNSPGAWGLAPVPSAVSVRAGAGLSGSDRVEITWLNSAIKNQWLEVQVLATARTGLASADIFFWGHKTGDVGAGTPPGVFVTSGADKTTVLGSLGSHVSLTSTRDFNRDGNVTGADVSIAAGSFGAIMRLLLAAGDAAVLAPAADAWTLLTALDSYYAIASGLAASAPAASRAQKISRSTGSSGQPPHEAAPLARPAMNGLGVPVDDNIVAELVETAADDASDWQLDDELLAELTSGQ